ncbi:hypothetical protein, partial [Acinetobacter baumannii]|uniref:hypothetical protein n=1 Tax=Acinetobacter baumannii TaxID=470 RepID=UPI0037C17E5D
DAYKVKDKAVMKVRIKAEEYEVPFDKLNIRYSDKYLTEYKKDTSARFDSRHKAEMVSKFNQQLQQQKQSQPSQNLNAPNSKMTQSAPTMRHAPRM